MNKGKTKARKILIVEDDETSDLHLSILMKDYAEETIHTDNGMDAIEICKKNPDIDLILMDIKLPVLNGYNAVREIRKFNPDVLIIAQTAFAMPGERKVALDAGCNDYIAKPINKNRLIGMVVNHLGLEV